MLSSKIFGVDCVIYDEKSAILAARSRGTAVVVCNDPKRPFRLRELNEIYDKHSPPKDFVIEPWMINLSLDVWDAYIKLNKEIRLKIDQETIEKCVTRNDFRQCLNKSYTG